MPDAPISQLLDQARRLWTAGQFAPAEAACRQILAADPRNVKALQMLGDLAVLGRRADIGVQTLTAAAALDPANPDVQISLGNAQFASGHLEEAITAFQHALVLQPSSAAAHHNLCISLKQVGRLTSGPSLDRALDVLSKVAARHPDRAQGYSELAEVLAAAGRHTQAIDPYRRAIKLAPRIPGTYINMATSLWAAGQPAEAVQACQRAIDLGFKDVAAYNQLGVALHALGKLDQAIAAFQQVTTLEPKFAQGWANLGISLRSKGLLDQAVATYQKSIELQPLNPQAFNLLGNVLCDCGLRAQALEAYRKSLQLLPTFVAADDNLVYTLYFDPQQDPATILAEHRRWNRQHAASITPAVHPPRDRPANRPLRIGYVSADFRHHVVGLNVLPLLEHRDRSRFHVTCYSNIRSPDSITERFQKSADQWRPITGVPDAEVARQIQADHIDILVDLTLHMKANRLLVFAHKPAPVQVTFAGYPGTTGLTAIDYRLTDLYLDPPGTNDSFYSETSIRLADSFWVYAPLENQPPVNELPAATGAPVAFGCLNSFSKLNEITLQAWSRVLHAVPQSRLILLAPQGQHRQRTISQLAVSPDRVEFVDFQPHMQYLQTYHRIDIGLDTFPYNGHTTSLDAMWMGVPVVSLAGQTAVSRAGFSQSSNLGLTELIASTWDEFVRIAADLAANLPRLHEMRSSLRSRMESSPLMDTAKFARSVEAAYLDMWNR